jgi:RimJ/RimL family protein N-acetyltransferase
MARIVLPAEPLVEGDTAMRAWRDSDLHALVQLCQDPEISRWTRVPFPYGEQDARLYLLHRYDAILAGERAPFAIVAPGDGPLLGSISLLRIDSDRRRAEVGYMLAVEARGRGHATRAVAAVCRWGFTALKLDRIQLLAATENGPSQRVAERAGFTREAVLRSFTARPGGGRQDMVAYSLLKSDLG